ncbi:TetR/AcrR family transcriptional regulator [Mesorhizobium sp. B2-4-14]|uniref:TetR/AcrR family transcriptional regulator n=1 Tax=Mesorhizobium sp. B2-4-14 TaxID=2589935 RepID=UPI00112AB342|nr:TetR/AcrR family transcriptional regulator [Mesorhizobium sp. B2-4-14]TPL11501.1 TetR/AcrR family transcriptional regulator [Mesorhizobium sp. B2-4-14]
MVHNTKVSRRGRPQLRSDEETRQFVVTAARQEFNASGYARASMSRIAERAGVSTKTMYRLIPTKAELFRSVISDRISRFILELDEAHLDMLPIEEALEQILIAYATLTLDGDTVSTLRLVFAECDHFPEIAAAFAELAVGRTIQTMESWLTRQRDSGEIEIDDPSTAVGMLRGMMIMEPQRALMLGQRQPPDQREIVERAHYCARLFLDGCRRRKGRPAVGSLA